MIQSVRMSLPLVSEVEGSGRGVTYGKRRRWRTYGKDAEGPNRMREARPILHYLQSMTARVN